MCIRDRRMDSTGADGQGDMIQSLDAWEGFADAFHLQQHVAAVLLRLASGIYGVIQKDSLLVLILQDSRARICAAAER